MNERWSIRRIGKTLQLGAQVVSKVMDQNHIPQRNDREQALKYTCNESFFSSIQTEQQAYWLGFLYADGYILPQRRGVGVTLAATDKGHLIKFEEDVEFNGHIHQYHASPGAYSSNDYARIQIISPQLADDLIKLGCVPNKTKILKFPMADQVPERLLRHFSRGFIDGNGSVQLCLPPNKAPEIAVKATGTKEVMLGLLRVFKCEHLKLSSRHHGRANNYSITCGGNIQALRILDFLYKDATVYLERKYLKYLQCKEEYQKFIESSRLKTGGVKAREPQLQEGVRQHGVLTGEA